MNIASFGMSGDVDQKVNQSSMGQWLGGTGTFFLATLQTLAGYQNKRVKYSIDDRISGDEKIRMIAAANGQYAGGGMRFAPQARIDDGLLDIVVMGDLSAAEVLLNTPRVYQGTHFESDKVNLYHGKKLTATSEDEVLLDIDGEAPGKLPASF